MVMELCPCCGSTLLRHVSKSGAYLRCGSCRFEISEDLPATTDESPRDASLLDKLEASEVVAAS